MDVADAQGTLVFRAAAAEFASAGNHAVDGDFGHRLAPRDQNCHRLVAEIKWPNDLLLGGKKAAGILTEMSAEMDRVRHVILGIGVDVNQDAGEFPPELRKIATSLKIESGKEISRAELAVEILRELDLTTRGFAPENFPKSRTNGKRRARPSAGM